MNQETFNKMIALDNKILALKTNTDWFEKVYEVAEDRAAIVLVTMQNSPTEPKALSQMALESAVGNYSGKELFEELKDRVKKALNKSEDKLRLYFKNDISEEKFKQGKNIVEGITALKKLNFDTWISYLFKGVEESKKRFEAFVANEILLLEKKLEEL